MITRPSGTLGTGTGGGDLMQVNSGDKIQVLAGGSIDTSAGTGLLVLAAGEIATADLAAAAVTGPKLDLSSLKLISAAGGNGTGTVSGFTGLLSTDRIVGAFGAPTAGGDLSAYTVGAATTNTFSPTPAAASTITQNSTVNLSTSTIVLLALPASA